MLTMFCFKLVKNLILGRSLIKFFFLKASYDATIYINRILFNTKILKFFCIKFIKKFDLSVNLFFLI